EGDISEVKSFEDAREFDGHGGIEGARQFVASNLDTHDGAVVPHSILLKAKPAQGIFTLFHRGQGFRGYRAAIFDARSQTGRSRLLPNPEACLPGQLANIRLA